MTTSINSDKLFRASCMALVVTSMTFAIRAGMLTQLGVDFGLSNYELGLIASMAFLGFPVANLIGGPLCDVVGMGRLLVLSFVAHLLGIVLTIFATGFWSLFISTFFIGFANGMVEAACNPLVATLYPTNKTTRLNNFHMWFPGGLVIGGLISYSMTKIGWNWQVQMASILIPAIVYGWMFFGQQFPKTERVASGISYKEMLKACLNPLFLFMIACMFLTAVTELGTNQWIDVLLKSSGVSGILILVWISGIMATGRYFAGGVVHKLSPSGVLLVSAILSLAGLLALSAAEGYWIYVAATIFAMGVTYFWPTMLGFVSENIPASGATGLALMGGAGMFSGSVFQTLLGKWYDSNLAEAGSEVLAGQMTLKTVAILPAILVVAFALLHFYMMRVRKVKSD